MLNLMRVIYSNNSNLFSQSNQLFRVSELFQDLDKYDFYSLKIPSIT